MSARKNKSDIWSHFEKLSSTKVKCKLCSKELSISGGVTSSMHGHMRSKHPSVFEQSHANSTPEQHSCPDSRAEKIIVALAEVIIDNMLPLSIVESDSLRRLLELLEPQYKMRAMQTDNEQSSMKTSMSEQLADKLDSDARHIAITTDIWTSLSNEAYLSFTASYIDHDWTIKSPVLATVTLEDRHTQLLLRIYGQHRL